MAVRRPKLNVEVRFGAAPALLVDGREGPFRRRSDVARNERVVRGASGRHLALVALRLEAPHARRRSGRRSSG